MAVTIAETSGHVTETELKSPLSPPVTMRRNDRSHSPKYAVYQCRVRPSPQTNPTDWIRKAEGHPRPVTVATTKGRHTASVHPATVTKPSTPPQNMACAPTVT